MLLLPKAMSPGGIAVIARQADGSEFDSTVTSTAGWYKVRGGFDGRVEALLPDGTLLSAEVRQASSGNVNISFATTVVSRYAQSSPQASLKEVKTRVQTSLAVPTRINLQDDLGDSWRSFFSAKAFIQAAGATPLNTFIDQAVARAQNGGVQAFRIAHPYPTLYRSLHPREAALYGIEPAATVTGKVVCAAEPAGGTFWGGVCQGIVGNELTGGTNKIIGWACEGLHISPTGSGRETAQEYAYINQQLADIEASINQLQTSITTLAGVTACQAPVARLQANWTAFNSYLQSGDTASAATTLQNYVGTNQASADVTVLRNNLLGTPGAVTPMVPNYAALVDDAQLGSPNPPGSFMFMDVRTNDTLDAVGQVADYYLGWMQVGACMQAEWSHLDPNAFPVVAQGTSNTFASHTTLGQTLVSGWAADISSAEQLNAQPTIASDNVLVYSSKGWLMYPPIQGPDYPLNMGTDAYDFSLGPWPAKTWSMMTLSQLEDLHSLAQQLGGGNVNAGLFKLGVLGSDQTVDILICYEVYDSDTAYVYNITQGKTEQKSTSKKYNYMLARSLPGANEDVGTVQATLYPTSLTSSAANALLSCVGAYTGVSSMNLTPYVTWASSVPSDFTVANYGPTDDNPAGWWGTVFFHTISPTGAATASLCTSLSGTPGALTVARNLISSPGLSAPALGTAASPVLTSMLVSPNVVNYATPVPVPCHATGFYSDGSVKDLSTAVAWSLTSTKGIAAFDGTVANQLNLDSTEGDDSITITATYNGVDAPTQIQASGTVTTSFPP